MKQKLVISEQDLNSLFEKAMMEIGKINQQANGQKKRVIIQLAKDLEGKIPMDTICMEIVKRLQGRVSRGFIYDCLDIKYKQEIKAENARKETFILKPYMTGEKRNPIGVTLPSKVVQTLEIDVSVEQFILTVINKNELRLRKKSIEK